MVSKPADTREARKETWGSCSVTFHSLKTGLLTEPGGRSASIQNMLTKLLSPPPTVLATPKFLCEWEGFELRSLCLCRKYPYSLISLIKPLKC